MVKLERTTSAVLALVFFGASVVFIYRSFYGMRIEAAGLSSKNEGVKAKAA